MSTRSQSVLEALSGQKYMAPVRVAFPSTAVTSWGAPASSLGKTQRSQGPRASVLMASTTRHTFHPRLSKSFANISASSPGRKGIILLIAKMQPPLVWNIAVASQCTATTAPVQQIRTLSVQGDSGRQKAMVTININSMLCKHLATGSPGANSAAH